MADYASLPVRATETCLLSLAMHFVACSPCCRSKLFALCPYTMVTAAWSCRELQQPFPVLFAVLALLLSWAALARLWQPLWQIL